MLVVILITVIYTDKVIPIGILKIDYALHRITTIHKFVNILWRNYLFFNHI